MKAKWTITLEYEVEPENYDNDLSNVEEYDRDTLYETLTMSEGEGVSVEFNGLSE